MIHKVRKKIICNSYCKFMNLQSFIIFRINFTL
jgi:hypothetical protein